MPFHRLAGLAALALALLGAAPARAQTPIIDAAMEAIPALERAGNIPIVILTRTGDDPGQFWYSAMQLLCAKTGDNWCEGDVQILSDTTNLLGWSRILTYRPENSTADKKVCVILPPNPGISPGYVATGLAGGGAFSYRELPNSEEAEAFLYLLHAAACLSTGQDDQMEQRRSDAFAALTLTLIEGNTAFVPGSDVTPSRKFATFRNGNSTRWAVSVGERVLLDHWKKQAADGLRATGCNASVLPSTSIDTQAIAREGRLTGGNCTQNTGRTGVVSDGNLSLWTTPGAPWPTVSLPPRPYAPFGSFSSVDEGIRYAWTTAKSLATQR